MKLMQALGKRGGGECWGLACLERSKKRAVTPQRGLPPPLSAYYSHMSRAATALGDVLNQTGRLYLAILRRPGTSRSHLVITAHDFLIARMGHSIKRSAKHHQKSTSARWLLIRRSSLGAFRSEAFRPTAHAQNEVSLHFGL